MHSMTNCEKYCVTLSCLPEAECDQRKSPEGQPCVNCYTAFATNSQDAVKDAFSRHLQQCKGRPGLCQMSVEVELVAEDLVN